MENEELDTSVETLRKLTKEDLIKIITATVTEKKPRYPGHGEVLLETIETARSMGTPMENWCAAVEKIRKTYNATEDDMKKLVISRIPKCDQEILMIGARERTVADLLEEVKARYGTRRIHHLPPA